MIFLLISYFLLSHFSPSCSICSLTATCDSNIYPCRTKGGWVMMWNNWWLRLFSESSAPLFCGYSSFPTPSHLQSAFSLLPVHSFPANNSPVASDHWTSALQHKSSVGNCLTPLYQHGRLGNAFPSLFLSFCSSVSVLGVCSSIVSTS